MNKTTVLLSGIFLLSLVSCSERSAEIPVESIVGEWYSSEIGGSFCFDTENNFSLKVDISDTMYIDENNIAHIAGSDEDFSDKCHFDGKSYSFELNGAEMISMERENYSESAYGEYVLKGGILYEELSSVYGDLDDRYRIIVDKDELNAKISMCGYNINGSKITFSGDDLSFFGAETGTVIIYNFAVENDILTLAGENNTLVFSRTE